LVVAGLGVPVERLHFLELGATVAQARTKGKIPNSEWPSIVQRHLSGETIANIARSYDCTAPAIRYIVRRSTAAAPDTSAVMGPGHDGRPSAPLGTGKHWRSEKAEAAPSSGTGGREKAVGRPQQGEVPAPRGLGRDLVRRANGDIAAFIVALNAADTKLDEQAAEELREATDRLLQSCARTRLEIERMFPFSAQEPPGQLSAGD
jgi:hypothetical protein